MSTAAVLIAALLAHTAKAAPTVGYPFNNQLPPVARYGESYSYVLNSDTFSSQLDISVKAENLPSWMSFDSSSWTLSGTPASSDSSKGDQSLSFNLVASDSEGSVNSTCTLELTATAAPAINSAASLTSVLSSAGSLADSQSVYLVPGKSFEIDFPSNYFMSDGRTVVGHYAVTSAHAPLPIWLNFDGSTGKFTGTAPSVTSDIAPSISYKVLYIVSTFSGFTTASSEFRLLLGANSLTTNMTTVTDQVHAGVYFDYQIPFNSISANGVAIVPANISSVTTTIPSNASNWLSYSSANYTLSGTPPNGTNSVDVTTEVCATFGDCVTFTVKFDVENEKSKTIFSSSSWPQQNVTANTFFSYLVSDRLANSTDVTISASIPTAADWLTYNADNFTLSGYVPSSFNGSTITFTGSTSDGSTTETASLMLLKAISNTVSSVSSSVSSTSSTPSSSSSSHTSSSSATATSSSTGATTALVNKSSNKTTAIACGVAIPLGVIAIAAILLLLWFRRRRNQSGGEDQEKHAGADSPNGPASGGPAANKYAVSGPIAPSSGVLMAPVFKTVSLSDDDTVVETPHMPPKSADPDDWSTPQRVSAYNFMRMDGASDAASGHHFSDEDVTPEPPTVKTFEGPSATGAGTTGAAGAEPGAIGAGAAGAAAAVTAGAAAAAGVGAASAEHTSSKKKGTGFAGGLAAKFRSPQRSASPEASGINSTVTEPISVAPAGGATTRASKAVSKYSNVPRESWRHTNLTDRRWQDSRQSYASCASIPGMDEVTMQIASEEGEASAAGGAATYNKNMTRDPSSGNIRYLNSDAESSSPESRHNEFDEADEDALAEDNVDNNRFLRSDSSDSGHFGSDGSSIARDNSDRSLELRATRNQEGDFTWNETQVSSRSKLVDQAGQRKQSEMGHHKVPSGKAGEIAFV